jgi:hypothetical protein
MPGQLCSGTTVKNANVKDSKAYCEGYLARTQSVTPTNPHAAGSSCADAFDAGADAKANEASTDAARGCCAATGLDAAVI